MNNETSTNVNTNTLPNALESKTESVQTPNGLNGVKTGTIVRTITLAVALLNQILAAMGKSPLPFESEEITQVVSTAMTMAAAACAWWKNNSFTKSAIAADEYLSEIK